MCESRAGGGMQVLCELFSQQYGLVGFMNTVAGCYSPVHQIGCSVVQFCVLFYLQVILVDVGLDQPVIWSVSAVTDFLQGKQTWFCQLQWVKFNCKHLEFSMVKHFGYVLCFGICGNSVESDAAQ
eukprot:12785848-Ditylum_brightwellii.AAC.1